MQHKQQHVAFKHHVTTVWGKERRKVSPQLWDFNHDRQLNRYKTHTAEMCTDDGHGGFLCSWTINVGGMKNGKDVEGFVLFLHLLPGESPQLLVISRLLFCEILLPHLSRVRSMHTLIFFNKREQGGSYLHLAEILQCSFNVDQSYHLYFQWASEIALYYYLLFRFPDSKHKHIIT